MIRKMIPFLLLAVALAGLSTPAQAYIGPGAGITMLGALWGVIAAIVLAIGAVLFWPIRALLRRRKTGPTAPTAGATAGARDEAR